MQFNFLKKTPFDARPSLERRKEVGGKVEEKFPKDADLIVACAQFGQINKGLLLSKKVGVIYYCSLLVWLEYFLLQMPCLLVLSK